MLFCSIFQRGYSGTPISLYRSADAPLRLIEVYWGLLRKSYCFYKTCYRVVFPTQYRLATLSYTLADARISGKSQLASFWILGMIKPRISLRETIRLVQRPYVRQNNFKKIIEPSQQHSHMRRRYILRLKQLIGKSIHSLHRHPLIDPQIESDQYLLYPRYTSIQRSCTNPDPFIPSHLSQAHEATAARAVKAERSSPA